MEFNHSCILAVKKWKHWKKNIWERVKGNTCAGLMALSGNNQFVSTWLGTYPICM